MTKIGPTLVEIRVRKAATCASPPPQNVTGSGKTSLERPAVVPPSFHSLVTGAAGGDIQRVRKRIKKPTE